MPQPAASLFRVLALLAGLAAVAGCALDKEADVRARLDGWLMLGDTLYFESNRDCTAGLFALTGRTHRSGLKVSRNLSNGITWIRQGRAVAFDMPGRSPTYISERLTTEDLPNGLGVLSSGVTTTHCMTEEVKSAYVETLNAAGGLLIFDTEDNALAIVTADRSHVFFARGGV